MPAPSSSPVVLRRHLDDAGITRAGQGDALLPVAAFTALVVLLAGLADPRRRRGRRHRLSPILVLAVWAVAAGATSYVAIADRARYAATSDLTALGMTDVGPVARRGGHRAGVPSMATIRRVLMGIDVAALEAALRVWALARIAAERATQAALPVTVRRGVREQRAVFCLDGKTCRGGRRVGVVAPALVAALDVGTGVVATQTPIIAGNEIAAVATALSSLHADLPGSGGLAGSVIVADALHSQVSHATWLLARDAHFIFRAKGNQPTLAAAIAGQCWKGVTRHTTHDRDHARIQTRTIGVLSVAEGSWDALLPGVRQVIKMHRRRGPLDGSATAALKPIKAQRETVYFATSLTHHQAPPALLAAWIRAEWEIENSLHHVRDVTYREDASRIRTGAGPQVMAALRNTAISLARLDTQPNIAAAHREYTADASALLATILAA